ncbi:MAG: hypothetical protein JWN04_3847 [Myxococcaceae bacterium]|nr:hypothetical protein [Myxococcaceae bacterium]
MGLLDWIKPQGASLAELIAQLDAAKTQALESEHATATALTKFDADGSDASAKALAKARESEATAREHVGRAQRLLDAAKTVEAAKARKAMQLRKADLEVDLDPANVSAIREPGASEETKALLAAIEVNARRIELEVELSEKRSELRRLREQLGEAVEPVRIESIEPSRIPIAMALADQRHACASSGSYSESYVNALLLAFGGAPMMWHPAGYKQAAE